MPFLLLFLSFILLVPQVRASETALFLEGFEAGLRPVWQEKAFEGKTRYEVISEAGGHVLRAKSDRACSGLLLRKEYDPAEFPYLSWRWKIGNVLPKGDGRKREGDDYAARVYVIFPHWFFPLTRSINYIWANRLPQGSYIPNPFVSRSVMLALRSGDGDAGRWIRERRNVLEDYRMIFGEAPPHVGAIAIMTDTDNTGGSAVAYYDDIRIGN